MLFYDDAFWKVFRNTLVFMASAPVGIALALGVALLVNRPDPRPRHLPHDRLHVLSGHDGGGRHHLAVAL